MGRVKILDTNRKRVLERRIKEDKHLSEFTSEPHRIVMDKLGGWYAVSHYNADTELHYGHLFESEIEAEDLYNRSVDFITANQFKGRI